MEAETWRRKHDRPERELGSVLLDLKAAKTERDKIDQRLFDGGPRGGRERDDEPKRDELDECLSALDDEINHLEGEARAVLEHRTGVRCAHIEELFS